MRGIMLHAIVVALCTVSLKTSSAAAADMVPWVQDINTARQIAAARNQLILVHFFANNCPPCRNLEANVFSQAGFGHSVARSFVPVKINVSVSPDLARQFHVDRWPLDLIITPTGQEIHRMVSPQDGNEYMRILNQVAWRVSSAPNGMGPQVAARGFQNDQPRSAVASVSVSQLQVGQQLGGQAADQLDPNATSLPRIENRTPYFAKQADAGIAVGPPVVSPVASQHQDSYVMQATNTQPQVINNQFAHSPDTTNAIGGKVGQSPANAQASTTAQASAVAATSATAKTQSPRTAPSPRPTGANVAASAQTTIPAAKASPATSRTPNTGMDGYCPVTMIEEDRWVRGDKRWGAYHRGRTYLFHSAAAQQRFLDAPDRYSPALTGYDPVIFAEQGRYSEGKRRHGLRYNDEIYLFESEETLNKFGQAPDRFSEVVRVAIGAGPKVR